MDRREFLKRSGWGLLGLAASGSILSCVSDSAERKATPEELKKQLSDLKNMKVWWGDIHNHCNLTYGHGDLEDAISAAREQLDFCSITPHALWPDIPGENDPRLNWVIGYHTEAFKRLRAGGWDKYVKRMQEVNEPDKFLTFLSYECHSMEHGDHVALCYDYDTPLVECSSVPDLKAKLAEHKVFVTPHHMGYQGGYRGYNWAAFTDNDPQLPFVEMFSRHGLAEGDMGDYDYLHDMGPRVWEGTVLYGLEQGHKFGLMCSTDQHAGYPGSYGDGRIGVLADSLDRDKLWDAMSRRKVCGVTGDKIKIDFRVNGATMGDQIEAPKRNIYLAVESQNYIDYADIVKNGRAIARLSGPMMAQKKSGKVRAKLKVNFGWNREEEYVHWQGRLSLSGGSILDVQPCFRGAAFTSPQPGESHFRTRVNRVLSKSSTAVELDLYSTKNPNVVTPAQQGIILDVEMDCADKIVADFNGQKFSYTLAELLEGTKAHFMRGWLSESIQFCRATPEEAFAVATYFEDKAERDTDYYYVRVRQRDGQWAWSSPIWVKR